MSSTSELSLSTGEKTNATGEKTTATGELKFFTDDGPTFEAKSFQISFKGVRILHELEFEYHKFQDKKEGE